MSFRSLIFREFKLAKKLCMIQAGMLLSFMALIWGMVLTQDDASEFIETVLIMSALIAMMSPIVMDENFKSDIRSGWLSYSYALPIAPKMRVAARAVQSFAVVFWSALLSLGNSAAICAYTGEPFGVNYIVWHIVLWALMTLYRLPNEIFMLRARNSAELKKMQTAAGLMVFVLMVVVVAAAFTASGVTLEDLVDDEKIIDFPVFTASSLLWAVPLLLVTTAISFFVSYLSLRSAYPNAVCGVISAKTEKKPAEITSGKPEAAPIGKTDGAAGLLYKELKQNRLMIILAALTPVFLAMFPFGAWSIDVLVNHKSVNEWFEMSTDIIMRVVMLVCGFFIISGLISETFKGDDKKLWAYFVVSTPQGVKGFIYRKYVITLLMCVIFMASGFLAEHLIATLNYFVTGVELETSLSSAYLIMVYMLMFTCAFDVPFTLRYGAQKGSILKMTIMSLLGVAAVTAYDLIPEELGMKITNAVISFFNGEAAASLILILVCLLPYLAAAAFVLSYKISCKAYLKGVNEFVK